MVTRQLVLKEELRITRRITSFSSELQRVTLRHEELEVTRSATDTTA